MEDSTNADKNLHLKLSVAFLLGLGWSAVRPHDYFTWLLEVLPALLGFGVLQATYRRFRFSNFTYFLITIHALILCVGGHYTYAQVPLFNWIRDEFHLSRNCYDRVGHFAQGFVPVLITRELLLRTSPLRRGKWLFALSLCVALAISASYELFEWAVAEATGSAADAFLGSQGDVWDTQWDMFTALVGALCALCFVARVQDRSITRVLAPVNVDARGLR